MTTIRELDRSQFVASIDRLVEIYLAAMGAPATEATARASLMRSHAQREGLAVFVAGDPIVGFAYGYTTQPGTWWHERVRHGLRRKGLTSWLESAYELAEIHVLPTQQKRGLGRALLNRVVERSPGPIVLLSTPDRLSRARYLYYDSGFADLLTGFRFPGTPVPYAIMGLDLRSLDSAP